MNVDLIAKTCHEVNRAYCKSIGDNSQLAWEDAPEWQKESAINGVKFHQYHPDSKPSDSHDSWMKEKLEQGWQYGSVKDPAKKEHPCLVPYEDLPKEQQIKDALFIGVVRSMKQDPIQADKSLNTSEANPAKKQISDLEKWGVEDPWKLIAKASSKKQGWMKSTKAMEIGHGCLVQVTTQQGNHIAEALTWAPGVTIIEHSEEGVVVSRELITLGSPIQ